MKNTRRYFAVLVLSVLAGVVGRSFGVKTNAVSATKGNSILNKGLASATHGQRLVRSAPLSAPDFVEPKTEATFDGVTVSSDPESPNYDSAFLSGRLAMPRGDIWDHEPRNPAWATAVEKLAQEQLRELFGKHAKTAFVRQLDCRTLTCLLEIGVSASDSRLASLIVPNIGTWGSCTTIASGPIDGAEQKFYRYICVNAKEFRDVRR